MNEAFGKEKILFDRIVFSCQVCKQGGTITAAWLSLTRVILEGYCGHCHEISQLSFDLLKTDAWLRGEADLPDYGIEAVVTPTVATPPAASGTFLNDLPYSPLRDYAPENNNDRCNGLALPKTVRVILLQPTR